MNVKGANRNKAYLAIAVFIILVSLVKNGYSIVQLLKGTAHMAIWASRVGFLTGIIFFAVAALLVRNKWWHIGWLMIVLNEFLNFSVVHALSDKLGTLAILLVSTGTMLLVISGYSFLRYKRSM